MASKTSIVLTTRVPNELNDRINGLLQFSKLSRADVWSDLCDMWDRGALTIEDGHIVEVVTNEPVYDDYKDRIHRNLDRFVETLTDKGYPENIIADIAENILNSAREMNRFNPKRSKNDMGC